MKKIFLSFLLLFVCGFGFAQNTVTKTKSKTTTTTPAKTTKPAQKKPTEKVTAETAEQKEHREKLAVEKGRALTENMNKNLHFTPEQYEDVLKINQRSISQAEYAKVRYIKRLKKMNSELQNIGSSRMSLLKDVLTPQQFDAYNRKREEKMGLPGQNAESPNRTPDQNQGE
jgi:hypothetical protein